MDIKNLLAQLDDMEADTGMNIDEDLMLADDEGKLTVCIDMLYDLEERALKEHDTTLAQAIKDARIYADDVRSQLYHPEV